MLGVGGGRALNLLGVGWVCPRGGRGMEELCAGIGRWEPILESKRA